MELNNQPEIAEGESRLCGNCQTFFGTKVTNFMCSKCYNDQTHVKTVDIEETIQFSQKESLHLSGKETLIATSESKLHNDVEMYDENEAKVEEMKVIEAPAEMPKVSVYSITTQFKFCQVHQRII